MPDGAIKGAGIGDSIETRESWVVAVAAFVIIMISFGTPYVVVVALKPIAADMGGMRSAPALASALSYLGTASDGVRSEGRRVGKGVSGLGDLGGRRRRKKNRITIEEPNN